MSTERVAGREHLQIRFGGLAPPIAEQVAEQGLVMADAPVIQADADAIVRLTIRGLLTAAEKHRARKRLMRKIVTAVAAAATSAGTSAPQPEARTRETP